MKARLIFSLLVLHALPGCKAAGPDFVQPEGGVSSFFKFSKGRSASSSSGSIESWWKVFGDARLNALESTAISRSPQLSAAAARVREARSQLSASRADQAPGLTSDSSAQFAGESAAETIPGIKGSETRTRGQSYSLPFSASYELDLWGRVRRSVESSSASLEATEADHRGVWLTLTADVARYYYSVRSLDVEIGIVEESLRSLREAEEVNIARYRNGLDNELDAQRAKVQAANTEADLSELRRNREQTANALAILTGIPPAVFPSLVDAALLKTPPSIPAGVPSSLLRRRPDLAQSAATLHSRTAEIGIAEADRLPTLSLTGNGGFSSASLGKLLNRAGQSWDIGAGITAPLLDDGRLKAQAAQARARAEEALSDYRQSVLTALREVDDSLVALREQKNQETARDEAMEAATATAFIARARYQKGLANYLEVTDAEGSLLEIRRSRAQLTAARYASTVSLIKALGGAWN